MSERVLNLLTLAAAIGAGLSGGVFFAFSSFVMAGLARLPPPSGIAAMQAINITAVTPLFMAALFGTALISLAAAVAAALNWHVPGAGLALAGGVLFVAGTIVVTMIANVPLNDALAAADPQSADGAILWQRYLADWNFWNHVRTVSGVAAAALFTVALF